MSFLYKVSALQLLLCLCSLAFLGFFSMTGLLCSFFSIFFFLNKGFIDVIFFKKIKYFPLFILYYVAGLAEGYLGRTVQPLP